MASGLFPGALVWSSGQTEVNQGTGDGAERSRESPLPSPSPRVELETRLLADAPSLGAAKHLAAGYRTP